MFSARALNKSHRDLILCPMAVADQCFSHNAPMPLVSHPTFWVDFPITGASTDAMICEPGITMVQVPCTWSATQGIKRNVSAIGNVATMNSITDDLPSDLSWKTPPTDKCRAILTVLRDMESAKRPAKLRDAQIPGLDISSSTLNVGAGAIVQSAGQSP